MQFDQNRNTFEENLVAVELLPGCLEMLAFSEKSFLQATSSSSDIDGTGTRPYSGAVAFLQFTKKFPNVFNGESVIELGCGIGACGLMIASVNHLSKVLLTDGEPTAVQLAKRNCDYLGLKENVTTQQLVWSTDPQEVYNQLGFRLSFSIGIGTDLLYYRTDVQALIATATLLCEKILFLPAIIRVAEIPHNLKESAETYGWQLFCLDLESFCEDLESIVGWYNITFLVLVRTGAVLSEEMTRALQSSRIRPYDLEDVEQKDSHSPFESLAT